MASPLSRLGVALLRQGDAHLLRQRADVLGGEGQTRQPQGEGGIGERAQTAGGFRNQGIRCGWQLWEDVAAVAARKGDKLRIRGGVATRPR